MFNTGYKELDYIFKGFKKEKLYVISSRPGVGMTSFSLNVLLNMTVLNYKTCFISVKEDDSNIKKRLISIISGIRYKRNPLPKEKEYFLSSLKILSHLSLNIESMKTIAQIETYLESHKYMIDCLFIDDLDTLKQNMKDKSNLDMIMKNLKDLSIKYNLSIILISSTSKRIELRKNKMPRPTDLISADNILKYVSNIIFIHRDSYYKKTYSIVNMESIAIIVTDPKVNDYRLCYLEFIHDIQRFYSKLFEYIYVDNIISNVKEELFLNKKNDNYLNDDKNWLINKSMI